LSARVSGSAKIAPLYTVLLLNHASGRKFVANDNYFPYQFIVAPTPFAKNPAPASALQRKQIQVRKVEQYG